MDPDLSGANLKGADLALAYAKLIGVDLAHSYLEGANFTGAYLKGVNLTDANLTDVIGLDQPPPLGREEKARIIAEANTRIFAKRAADVIASVDGHLSGKAVGPRVDAVDGLEALIRRTR